MLNSKGAAVAHALQAAADEAALEKAGAPAPLSLAAALAVATYDSTDDQAEPTL